MPVRVRPVYWILFFVCCAGVLAFAALHQEHVPALLHMQVQRHDTSSTVIALSLADTQGLPIEDAHVSVQAFMKGMSMAPPPIHVSNHPQGFYQASLGLSMEGSWIVTIAVYADGFLIPRQALCLQVEPGH